MISISQTENHERHSVQNDESHQVQQDRPSEVDFQKEVSEIIQSLAQLIEQLCTDWRELIIYHPLFNKIYLLIILYTFQSHPQ